MKSPERMAKTNNCDHTFLRRVYRPGLKFCGHWVTGPDAAGRGRAAPPGGFLYSALPLPACISPRVAPARHQLHYPPRAPRANRSLSQRLSGSLANHRRFTSSLRTLGRQAALLGLAFFQFCFPAVQAATLAPAPLRTPYDPAIERVALKNGVDANLLRAIINVESGFRPTAYNGGAVGLMQVKPSTAHHFGIHNVHNPVQNIEAGGRYLRHLLDMFNHNIRLAVAAYNAGEGTILRRNNRLPVMTHHYVTKVMAFWHSYQQLY